MAPHAADVQELVLLLQPVELALELEVPLLLRLVLHEPVLHVLRVLQEVLPLLLEATVRLVRDVLALQQHLQRPLRSRFLEQAALLLQAIVALLVLGQLPLEVVLLLLLELHVVLHRLRDAIVFGLLPLLHEALLLPLLLLHELAPLLVAPLHLHDALLLTLPGALLGSDLLPVCSNLSLRLGDLPLVLLLAAFPLGELLPVLLLLLLLELLPRQLALELLLGLLLEGALVLLLLLPVALGLAPVRRRLLRRRVVRGLLRSLLASLLKLPETLELSTERGLQPAALVRLDAGQLVL